MMNSATTLLFTITLISTCMAAHITATTTTAECTQCNPVACPISDNECPSLSRVTDPCACCTDGVCPAQETEPCGTPSTPCDRGLVCNKVGDNKEAMCQCRRDKRPVCGTDNTTYISICQLQRQPHKPTLLKWGQCDRAPEVVSASGDIMVVPGQPMALDCEVKGTPIPNIMWHFTAKDGSTKILPSDDQVTAVLVRGGPEHMMVTSWMQIVEARTTDEGVYACIATNEHGTVKHKAKVSMINKI